MLRKAFLLWDDERSATTEGREMYKKGVVRGFGLLRIKCALVLALHALRRPNDLWLCTHINYAFLGMLLSFWRRRRVCLFIYAAELDVEMTFLKRFALRRVGYIVAISEYSKAKAVKMGVDADRITVMHLGSPDPCPNRKFSTESTGQNQILFVGRMDERYKGQDELLDAVLLLRRRFPEVRLVFIGGGRNLDEWKREAGARELLDIVEFRGRVSDDDLCRAYESATVFAMPSRNEGFGLVYVEAMAYGLPCIGGDRDAAREVIAHGETGFCIPAGNSTALSYALQTLFQSPDLRTRFSLASRERFLAHFCAPKYAERLVRVLVEWRMSSV